MEKSFKMGPLRSRLNVAVLFVVLGIFLFSFAGKGTCAVLEVGPGKRFAEIQQAVTAAEPEDVIKVAPGTYRGGINLQKNLTLVGTESLKSRCVIRGSAPLLRVERISKGRISGFTFVVQGGNTVPAIRFSEVGKKFEFQNCRIDGKGTGSVGLRFGGKSAPKVAHVSTRGFVRAGWEITEASTPEVRQCYFRNNKGASLWFSTGAGGEFFKCIMEQSDGVGIMAVGEVSATICNTLVESHATPFRITDNASITFENSVILNNLQPGTLEANAALSAVKTTFVGNANGHLVVSGNSSLTMDAAMFRGNARFGVKAIGRSRVKLANVVFDAHRDLGLYIGEDSTLNATDCEFVNCPQGIDIAASENNKHTLLGCRFTACNVGIVNQGLGTITCDSCEFDRCRQGVKAEKQASVVLQRTRFDASGDYAVKTADQASMELTGCRFEKESSRLLIEGSARVRVQKSMFAKLSTYAAEVRHKAQLEVEKSEFVSSVNGIKFEDQASGRVYECRASQIDKIWILIKETSGVRVEKNTLSGASTGIAAVSGGKFVSEGNHFESCTEAAVSCTHTSTFLSKGDWFVKNAVGVLLRNSQKGEGSEILNPRFSLNGEAALALYGASTANVKSASFSEEAHPVTVHDHASVSLERPVFQKIPSGGIITRNASRLVLEQAVFKNSNGEVLSALDQSQVQFNKTEFIGGQGPVLILKGRATAEFTECRWLNLSGVALALGESVHAKLTDCGFSKVDIPIKATAQSGVTIQNVTFQENEKGIVLMENSQMDAQGLEISRARQAALEISSAGSVQCSNGSVDSRIVGIICEGQSHPNFTNVKISAEKTGILVRSEAQCNVQKFVINLCAEGIEVRDRGTIQIKEGEIANVQTGIGVHDHGKAELIQMVLKQSKTGVMVSGESLVRATSSSIEAELVALYIKEGGCLIGEKTTLIVGQIALHLTDRAQIDFSTLSVEMKGDKGTCVLIDGNPTGNINGLIADGGDVGLSLSSQTGLLMKNIQIANAKQAGLIISGNGDLTIDSGTIANCGMGALLTGQARPRITASTFSLCKTGLMCEMGAMPRIEKCHIKDCEIGVTIKDKSRPNISELHVEGGNSSGCAVEYTNESGGELLSPFITTTLANGIIIRDNSSPYISGTTEAGRIRSGGNGITVLGSSRPVLANLTIDGNAQYGIFVQGTGKAKQPARPIITGCRIRNHMNGAGICLAENADALILGLYRKDTQDSRIKQYAQNIIRSNLVGILLIQNAKACIDGNMIENNSTGIELTGISKAGIYRNNIRDSKFVEIDRRGEGVVMKEKATAEIAEHNRIYRNRMAGILVAARDTRITIKNNEIYKNINIQEGSALKDDPLGGVMVAAPCEVVFAHNYIHDNNAPGITLNENAACILENNLIEQNRSGALRLTGSGRLTVANNTLVGSKHDDSGVHFGPGARSKIKDFSFYNNVIYKFANAFNAAKRMRSLPKRWSIERNSIHNCECENSPNFPDLLKNYRLDPIFHNPNGKGIAAFTPEQGSQVCQNTPRYDWGKTRYAGAFPCTSAQDMQGQVEIAFLTPSQDGDIVSRMLDVKAEVTIPPGKRISSWALYVNDHLAKQSRGIRLSKGGGDDRIIMIHADVVSLPYGQSTLRLVIYGEAGEEWTAERVVYTAKCSEFHKRWVLLVGVSDYEEKGGIPDLTYAAADAKALEEMLNRRSHYAPFQDVEVILLTDEFATREGLREALFGRIAPCARAEDEVIIFFAGHGLVGQDRFYLAMHDTDMNRIELTGYEMQEFRDVIRYNIKSNRVLLMFDACHSGGVNLERQPASALNQHLVQMTQGSRNLTVISASRDDEVSFENSCCCPDGGCDCKGQTELGSQGHGYFTCALLHGMRGEATKESDRMITIQSLVEYLKETVPEMSGQHQHPQIFGRIEPEFVITTAQ